jgi:hypothetical protein
MYLIGILRLEDHEHEDGILEVGGVVSPCNFQLLVGDDQIDDCLDCLLLDELLDIFQEFL